MWKHTARFLKLFMYAPKWSSQPNLQEKKIRYSVHLNLTHMCRIFGLGPNLTKILWCAATVRLCQSKKRNVIMSKQSSLQLSSSVYSSWVCHSVPRSVDLPEEHWTCTLDIQHILYSAVQQSMINVLKGTRHQINYAYLA